MTSKKKNVRAHFRRRSLERVGIIVDENGLIKKFKNENWNLFAVRVTEKKCIVQKSLDRFFVLYMTRSASS